MSGTKSGMDNKELRYKHWNLSDVNVVKYLIFYRSKIYDLENNIAMIESGTFDFNCEVIALYASLDSTISKCEFSSYQMRFINLLFEGHSLSDIYHMNIGYGKSNVYIMIEKIIDAIVNMNRYLWQKTISKD